MQAIQLALSLLLQNRLRPFLSKCAPFHLDGPHSGGPWQVWAMTS